MEPGNEGMRAKPAAALAQEYSQYVLVRIAAFVAWFGLVCTLLGIVLHYANERDTDDLILNNGILPTFRPREQILAFAALPCSLFLLMVHSLLRGTSFRRIAFCVTGAVLITLAAFATFLSDFTVRKYAFGGAATGTYAWLFVLTIYYTVHSRTHTRTPITVTLVAMVKWFSLLVAAAMGVLLITVIGNGETRKGIVLCLAVCTVVHVITLIYDMHSALMYTHSSSVESELSST